MLTKVYFLGGRATVILIVERKTVYWALSKLTSNLSFMADFILAWE
jgi:hypothetical protein